MDQLTGRWRGRGHVQHAFSGRAADQDGRAALAGAGGQAGPGAGTLTPIKEPLVPKLGEGGGDSGAADLQDVRQLALAGQNHVQRQAAVQDQQAQRLGQLAIGGARPLAAPGTEQSDQGGGT